MPPSHRKNEINPQNFNFHFVVWKEKILSWVLPNSISIRLSNCQLNRLWNYKKEFTKSKSVKVSNWWVAVFFCWTSFLEIYCKSYPKIKRRKRRITVWNWNKCQDFFESIAKTVFVWLKNGFPETLLEMFTQFFSKKKKN